MNKKVPFVTIVFPQIKMVNTSPSICAVGGFHYDANGNCKFCSKNWMACNCDQEEATVDKEKYPHICPKCKGPAFIGFNQIDCKRNCI